jgi:hypothetical protein
MWNGGKGSVQSEPACARVALAIARVRTNAREVIVMLRDIFVVDQNLWKKVWPQRSTSLVPQVRALVLGANLGLYFEEGNGGALSMSRSATFLRSKRLCGNDGAESTPSGAQPSEQATEGVPRK